ncbi:MAG: hypothetical protein ACE5G9_11545 [Nitrospinales bacterium]
MTQKKPKPNWKMVRENNPVAQNLSDPKFRKRVVESKKTYKRTEGKKVEPEGAGSVNQH